MNTILIEPLYFLFVAGKYKAFVCFVRCLPLKCEETSGNGKSTYDLADPFSVRVNRNISISVDEKQLLRRLISVLMIYDSVYLLHGPKENDLTHSFQWKVMESTVQVVFDLNCIVWFAAIKSNHAWCLINIAVAFKMNLTNDVNDPSVDFETILCKSSAHGNLAGKPINRTEWVCFWHWRIARFHSFSLITRCGCLLAISDVCCAVILSNSSFVYWHV